MSIYEMGNPTQLKFVLKCRFVQFVHIHIGLHLSKCHICFDIWRNEVIHIVAAISNVFKTNASFEWTKSSRAYHFFHKNYVNCWKHEQCRPIKSSILKNMSMKCTSTGKSHWIYCRRNVENTIVLCAVWNLTSKCKKEKELRCFWWNFMIII